MIRGWGSACLALFLVVATGCEESPEEAKARHFELGKQLVKQGKPQEAVIAFTNAIQLDAKHRPSRVELAKVYQLLGRTTQEREQLEAARDLDPEEAATHVRLAQLYLMVREPDRAEEEVKVVLERDKGNLEALTVQAFLAKNPADIDAAIEALKGGLTRAQQAAKRLAVASDYATSSDAMVQGRCHIALALLYSRKKMDAEADAAFASAIAAEPTAPLPLQVYAEFLQSRKRYDEAEAKLKQAATLGKASIPARLDLVDFYRALGRNAEALAAVDAILVDMPDAVEVWMRKAELICANAARAIDPCLAAVDLVLQKAPKHSEARYLRGLALKEAGRTAEAIQELEALALTNPKVAKLHVALGEAYLELPDADKALAAYQRFAELTPGDARGTLLVGVALRKQGKDEEARKSFTKALEAQAGFSEALGQLVMLNIAAGKKDEALAQVNAEILRSPKSGRLHDLLGTVQASRGDFEAAIAAYTKALELDPGLLDTQHRLSRVLAALGRTEEALAQVNLTLESDPRLAPALLLSGLLYQKKGELATARERYERVLAVQDDNLPATNNLAYIYAMQGDRLEDAQRLAERARAADPKSPTVADTLGWIHYLRGNYAGALPLLQEAVHEIPESPEASLHLGQTLKKLGAPEARVQLERARTLGKGTPLGDEADRALKDLR